MEFLFPHMAHCEPFFQVDHLALPSVTLLWCHVASPNLAMCHPTPHASKNVKSRPPRNPTKFDVVAKFRETISTEKSVRHPRSRKIPDFYRNYDFALFEKNWNFLGSYILPFLKRISSRNSTHIHIQPCAYVTLPNSKTGSVMRTRLRSQLLTTRWFSTHTCQK